MWVPGWLAFLVAAVWVVMETLVFRGQTARQARLVEGNGLVGTQSGPRCTPYARRTHRRRSYSARRRSRGRLGRKTADGDDRRGAHAEGPLRVALLEANANLEPVGQAHPVQGAPHLGQHPTVAPSSG